MVGTYKSVVNFMKQHPTRLIKTISEISEKVLSSIAPKSPQVCRPTIPKATSSLLIPKAVFTPCKKSNNYVISTVINCLVADKIFKILGKIYVRSTLWK